jgi:hypothetical protein
MYSIASCMLMLAACSPVLPGAKPDLMHADKLKDSAATNASKPLILIGPPPQSAQRY